MALAEGEAGGDIRWEDPLIPYLQLINLDFRLADGRALRLQSQLDDGAGFHGLHLVELETLPVIDAFVDPATIFRARTLSMLPVGQIEAAECLQDGIDAKLEMKLAIAGAVLRVVAGEIHEQDNGSLLVVQPDESMLLQLNGQRPS